MSEAFPVEHLSGVTRGMWRNRWIAMLAAWCIVLVGWPAAYFISAPKFTAKAQLYIDTQSVLNPELKGLTLPTNPSEQLGLMSRRLLARPNLERVVADVGLGKHGAEQTPSDITIVRLRDNVELTAERASPDSSGFTNFYSISYKNRDPDTATKVVKALIDAFVENTLAQVREDADQAIRYLDEQIAARGEQLERAQARLQDIRQKNLGVLALGKQGYFERLTAAQDEVRDVELDIQKAKSYRETLKAQLRSTPPRIRALSEDGTPMPSADEKRLDDLKRQLDDGLLKYTESHPKIQELRESIAVLEREISRSPEAAPTAANPLYEQLQLRLSDVDANLAALRTQHERYAARVDRLRAQMATLPKTEAALKRLEEESSKMAESYQALVSRRQSIETSRQLAVDKGDVGLGEEIRFRVVEPPSVSVDSTLLKTWKKRLTLVAVVFCAGLFGGGLLAFGLLRVRPSVYGQRALGEVTSLPVLGVISRVTTPAWRRRRLADVTVFVICGLLLVASCIGAAYIQHHLTYSISSEVR